MSLFTIKVYWWNPWQPGGPQCIEVLFGCEAELSLLKNVPPPPKPQLVVLHSLQIWLHNRFPAYMRGGRDIISLLCIHFLHLYHIVNKSGHHLKTTAERLGGAEVKLRPLLSGAVDGQLHADASYIEGCSASRAVLYVVAKRKNSIPVPEMEHRSSSLFLSHYTELSRLQIPVPYFSEFL
jgi:hypothetical protein